MVALQKTQPRTKETDGSRDQEFHFNSVVTQSVEYKTFNFGVASSSLATVTNKIKGQQPLFDLPNSLDNSQLIYGILDNFYQNQPSSDQIKFV